MSNEREVDMKLICESTGKKIGKQLTIFDRYLYKSKVLLSFAEKF